jgi:hypothetical protein
VPLLEVQKITHVTATITIEQPLAVFVDKYAAFIHATADEVVNNALEYVFARDKEFQRFLASDEATSVSPSLHVKESRNGGSRGKVPGRNVSRQRGFSL